MPDPKMKGVYGGNCNRFTCQEPTATWYNASTRAFYCRDCAREINRGSRQFHGMQLCYHAENLPQALELKSIPYNEFKKLSTG